MPKLSEVAELVRISQAVAVLNLVSEHGYTQAEACDEVGITERVFRRWVRQGHDTMDALRTLLQEQQRNMLLEASFAREKLLMQIIEKALDPHTDLEDKIKAWPIIHSMQEKLEGQQREVSGYEQDAQKYLIEGPKLQKATSRLKAEVNVRPEKDGSVTLTTYSDQDIVEAEFEDVPETSREPDEPHA